jgi:hypothetical protein
MFVFLNRIKGPLYTGFQPLRNDEKALSEELKEKFICFVDKDECSKEKTREESEMKLCKNCAKILQNIMSVSDNNK